MALGLIIQRRPYFPPGGWLECSGMGGRNESECPAGMDRNRWPECVGIRTQRVTGEKIHLYVTRYGEKKKPPVRIE